MSLLGPTIEEVRAALAQDGSASSDYDLNPDVIPVEHGIKSPAAVLFPLIEQAGRLEVILTKRAQHLRHHPGQIAFPGGKVEESDASPEAAALREAEEEIGLSPDNVEVLGALDAHVTVTHFTVMPFVALVRKAFEPRLDRNEVEELIFVPLEHLADPDRYLVEGRMFRGSFRKYYTVPHGPHYIWGATARMTLGLAERMAR